MDIERQVLMLYEIPSLTEELRDDAAKLLLKWGEQQVQWLAMRGDESLPFEDACGQLQRLMKYINRFIGRRVYADAEKLEKIRARLLEAAKTLGYTVDEAVFDKLLQSPQDDDADDVELVLSAIQSSSATDAAAVAPASDSLEVPANDTPDTPASDQPFSPDGPSLEM
ncbi:MAG: hypothetical protein D6712_07925 [Chloroflexi bacterium]|nr:MAG: hypothetical protein D6712_07925 [Chloroflexota bacterium]